MNNIKSNGIIFLITVMILLTVYCSFCATADAADKDEISRLLTKTELTSIQENNNINRDGLNFVISDWKKTGVNVKDAEIKNDKFVLHTNIEEINATIIVDKAIGKNVKMHVYEGDKHNVIEYDDNDKMYVDGKIIEAEEEISDEKPADDIAPIAQARYGRCPWGRAKDYTYYVREFTMNMVLARAISKMTVHTLADIIESRLKLVGKAATGIARDAINNAIDADGKVLKRRAKIYYHKKKKTFMVTNTIGCQREATYFYGARNKVLARKTIWLYSHVNGA